MAINELKDLDPKSIRTCHFCGVGLYEGDEWKNFLEKSPKTGQDAANAYGAREDKAICEKCEMVHPLQMFSHDGITWAELKEI